MTEATTPNWVIVWVEGGIANVNAAGQVEVLTIDWDNIRDNWTYAADTLGILHTYKNVPDSEIESIRGAIANEWPEQYADYVKAGEDA